MPAEKKIPTRREARKAPAPKPEPMEPDVTAVLVATDGAAGTFPWAMERLIDGATVARRRKVLNGVPEKTPPPPFTLVDRDPMNLHGRNMKIPDRAYSLTFTAEDILAHDWEVRV